MLILQINFNHITTTQLWRCAYNLHNLPVYWTVCNIHNLYQLTTDLKLNDKYKDNAYMHAFILANTSPQKYWLSALVMITTILFFINVCEHVCW